MMDQCYPQEVSEDGDRLEIHDHLMIDIETWATTDNAIMRALAAVSFDPMGDGVLECMLIDASGSVDDQIRNGRRSDPETIAWWSEQPPLFPLIKTGVIDMETHLPFLPSSLRTLIEILKRHIHPMIDPETDRIREYIWTRGHFDCRIIRNAWKTSTGEDPPWSHRQEMDVRTLDRLTTRVNPEHPHNPLSDCMAQVMQVQNAYRANAASSRAAS